MHYAGMKTKRNLKNNNCTNENIKKVKKEINHGQNYWY